MIAAILADAPNPADCPHQQCAYGQGDWVGWVAIAIVVIALLLAVGLVVLAVRRWRSRSRSSR